MHHTAVNNDQSPFAFCILPSIPRVLFDKFLIYCTIFVYSFSAYLLGHCLLVVSSGLQFLLVYGEARDEHKHRAESPCERLSRHVFISLFCAAICSLKSSTGSKSQNTFLLRSVVSATRSVMMPTSSDSHQVAPEGTCRDLPRTHEPPHHRLRSASAQCLCSLPILLLFLVTHMHKPQRCRLIEPRANSFPPGTSQNLTERAKIVNVC